MIKILALAVPICFSGCASKPPQPITPVYQLKGYFGPEAMSTDEVFMRSRDCIVNKMRPNVNYLYVTTDQGTAPVPISVICGPF